MEGSLDDSSLTRPPRYQSGELTVGFANPPCGGCACR